MANDPLYPLSKSLIAGRYAVDTSHVLLEAGGGLPAYIARDRMAADGIRTAISVSRNASPRLLHLKALTDPIENLMTPLGHGAAPLQAESSEGYFVICTPASGPPVSASLERWAEKPLLELVLKPVAKVLDALDTLNLTHRSVRLNNVFQSALGQPATLGAAWAAPPAMHQPAVYESPHSAVCHPAGRGEGTAADDVYALGVVLLALITGKEPMANMDDDTVIRWKLELGSFGALTRDSPLSGSFAELLRGMVADDPDHRPLPSQLVDYANLRGRRVGVRPPRRSQRPLMLNDIAVFNTQTLAYALSQDEKKAVHSLRNGVVTQWLRRSLGDAGLAAQIEELVRNRSNEAKLGPRRDPLLVMEAISAIDPRMPLCWRGVALWPDGLPGMLAEGIAAKHEMTLLVEELLVDELAAVWVAADSRVQRPDPTDITHLRTLLQGDGPGALLRLFYALNPLLPCRAPSMSSRWVMTITDLMEVLETTVVTAGDSLVDLQISTFIAARADRNIEMQVYRLVNSPSAEAFRLAELVLLQDLQTRYNPVPMRALAKWVAARLRPELELWRNKPRRQALQIRLEELAQAGILSHLLELTRDKSGLVQDQMGAQHAVSELALIDAEVVAIDNDEIRFADAERFGHAVAGGVGLSAFILMVMMAMMR